MGHEGQSDIPNAGAFDPLWVPLISHYRADGSLDTLRTIAQLKAISGAVRQYLVAGTTGDGWDMSEAVLDQWLAFCSDTLDPDQSFLIGAFAADTMGVIARAKSIERHFSARSSRGRFVGLTVCAPISPRASQAEIAQHFQAILGATAAPLAIYQLPQVTGCTIAPETFEMLARDRRVVLFKDTGGSDEVALSDIDPGGARLLRGAEGDYAAQLKDRGRYDGWLLSSANMVPGELRRIADHVATGRFQEADALSGAVSRIVTEIFEEAALLRGNRFADANRAGDHIRAYGMAWRSALPPRRSDGSTLSQDFLEAVAAIFENAGGEIGTGYLSQV